jgi:hypothetical protein
MNPVVCTRCQPIHLLKMIEDGPHECTQVSGGACFDKATGNGCTVPRMHWELVTATWAVLAPVYAFATS